MMWILLSACWLMAGCSSIDDDRTDCGEEEEELQLDYELRLVTNMTDEHDYRAADTADHHHGG